MTRTPATPSSSGDNAADAASPRLPGAENRRDYFGIDVPFMDTIGLEPLSLEDDVCRARLSWRCDLANSRGHYHGGTLMGALDYTMSAAARAHDRDNLGAATIDMNTQFYEPAVGVLDIEARCVRRGRAIAFCEAEARNAQGVVVVAARSVFRLVPQNSG